MKAAFVVLLSFLPFTLFSQEHKSEAIDLSRITDDLVSFQDGDSDHEQIYEILSQLYSKPLNLNTVTEDELRASAILTEGQIYNFFNHIKQNGKLLSIYELQSINGFDERTIHNLVPFVHIISPDHEINKDLIHRIVSKNNSYLVLRAERAFGVSQSTNVYSGPAEKFYMRFKTSRPNDYSFGFTTENDIGEPLLFNPKQNRFGFDYLSCHAQIQNKKFLTNFIVGDYLFQFGQGLILGNAFGFGKGGETITTIRKTNVGFVPYTSVNEAGYSRGIALTINPIRHVYLSGFFSNAKRDGTRNDSTNVITSFITTGLHRTEQEIGKRKNVDEVMYGAVVNYKKENLEIGSVFQAISFSLPVEKNPTVYNQSTFTGLSNTNLGVFANYTYENFNFFGEAGKSLDGGTGVVTGVLASLGSTLDISLLYRKYSTNFYSFYTNALSENTTPQNESGIYWGVKYRISKRYAFSSYIDLFRFPWLRFRSYAPSTGHEALVRFTYQPSRKNSMFIQFRQEAKDRNKSDESAVYQTGVAVKRNLSINFDFQISPALKLRSRAQHSSLSFDGATSEGFTFFQDIVFNIGKLELSGRHALFSTEDYDNRQYAYERDLFLAYSFPAYDGKGIRNYIIFEYKLNRSIVFSGRYSRTINKYERATDADAATLQGISRNDAKLQCTFRF
jgi:hypothetical protein